MSEVGQSSVTNPIAHPMATTTVDLSNLPTKPISLGNSAFQREASVRRQ